MSSNPWPNNYAEQAAYMQRLTEEVNRVKASRLGQAILRSYTPPTRQEWESAWSSQTDFPLPIPPGAKLCWYDLRSGRIKTFTTAYDIEGGQGSSGAIYEQFDTTEPLTSWQFLGVQNPNTFIINQGEQVGRYIGVNLVPHEQIRDGLIAWIVMFKLRFTDTTPSNGWGVDIATSLQFRMFNYTPPQTPREGMGSGGDYPPFPGTVDFLTTVERDPSKYASGVWPVADVVFGEQTGNTAPVRTTGSVTPYDPTLPSDTLQYSSLPLSSESGFPARNTHPDGVFSEGVMVIQNPLTAEISPDGLESQTLGSLGAYYQMTTWSSAGGLRLTQGSFKKYDRARPVYGPIFGYQALWGDFYGVLQRPYNMLGSDTTFDPGSKLWLYGIYAKNKNNSLEFK